MAIFYCSVTSLRLRITLIVLCMLQVSALLSKSGHPTSQSQSIHACVRTQALSILGASSTDDDGNSRESALDGQKRMEIVRSLQKSFYAQNDSDDKEGKTRQNVQLQRDTGIVTNLPLWRVGWVEVPGRANCLNVHEGQYTHMFETILNGPQPWYVGHLHLPGGFKMTRTGEYPYQLKTYKEELQDQDRFEEPIRSAVIGTLMRISDYRRLADGRLVLLTQVLERFVVENVRQEFPFSVADVQILPDGEELPTSDENFCKIARASAVSKSFEYHDYECAKVKLPLADDDEYLATNGVVKEEIAKLLPFAYYSTDDSLLNDVEEETSTKCASDNSDAFSEGQPSLERQLLAGRILKRPPSIPGVEGRQTQSIEATETLLWLALEDFCQLTHFELPEEVKCLMPPTMDYLDMGLPNQCLSPKYPNLRRQQRLGYAVAMFLENTDLGVNLRPALLHAPTTQGRLTAMLERFELFNSAINARMLGEFQ